MTTATTAATGLALISAALLGLRHGLDYDHVAAICDIAAVEAQPRHAMRLGLLYAVGHAITVATLGVAVILFQRSLPARIDGWMEQVVGATLLALGIYVFYSDTFRRPTHDHARLRSRVLLLADAALWLLWRMRQTFSAAPVPRRRVFQNRLGAGSAVLLGVIHGIGAETPTQLLIFLLAANLGGVGKGLLGLSAFLVGLFTTNALMCAMAAGLIRMTAERPRSFRLVANLSAAYSMVIGGVLLVAPALH